MSAEWAIYDQGLHSLNVSLCFKYKEKRPEVEYESPVMVLKSLKVLIRKCQQKS